MTTEKRHGNGSNGGFSLDLARERLEVTGTRLSDGGGTLPQHRIDEILAERAAQFARVPDAEEEGERVELTVVRLGTEFYGLDARFIFRIRPATQIAVVPRVPLWVRGITNERGRILSVIDLGSFLGLPQRTSDGPGAIDAFSLVIIETAQMELALLADEVLNVVSLPVSQLREAPDVVRGIPKEYVRGVVGYRDLSEHLELLHTESEEPTLVVLSLESLLADERLLVDEEIV